MATTQVPTDFTPAAQRRIDPSKYTALGDFLDEINKPDNRESLVHTYGDQGITGFLQMTGATKAAGTNDEVQWWEETRLHPTQIVRNETGGSVTTGASTFVAHVPGSAEPAGDQGFVLRNNDVVLIGAGTRAIVDGLPTTNQALGTGGALATKASCNITSLSGNFDTVIAHDGTTELKIIGNLFEQGSDQNDAYLESQVNKKTNKYMIMKESFKVTGSQATNIGWVNLGNGDYRWYVKGEADTRKRFMDKREMMMLLGESVTNSITTSGIAVDGSEGYFSAIEATGAGNGGIVFDCGAKATLPDLDSLSEFDAIIKELDKQGANPEYAVYGNTQLMLNMDDMIAQGMGSSPTSGVQGQFGAFNNDAELAVKLGFKSFSRGGYTFHKHSFKLLNEPTLLADSKFAGVMIPMATVVDPKSGDRNPALEMNFKSAGGYSRDMEHFITGSILGANTDTKDFAQFNYRSEVCLVTRAANRHVLLTQS
jgi:hypothetical protein